MRGSQERSGGRGNNEPFNDSILSVVWSARFVSRAIEAARQGLQRRATPAVARANAPRVKMTFEQIIDHFQAKRVGKEWVARCTGHDDSHPSLYITERNGKTLFVCRSQGCSFEQILAGAGLKPSDLNAVGSRVAEAYKASNKNRVEFTYTDVEVMTLAESLIEQWNNGGEVADFLRRRGVSREASLALRHGATVRTFHKVGNSAALAIPLYRDKQLVGVKYRAIRDKDFLTEAGSNMSGLYGLPDPNASGILLLEGPLDVALAMSFGFNAVGIQAADTAPTRTDLQLLGRYRTIYLIGDADRAGRKAINRWQAELNADYPEALVRVNLALKDIGDLYAADAKAFRSSLGAILRRARAGREFFELGDLYDEDELLESEPAEPHVVDQLVPAGAITMFFGEEKSGKSLLVRYFAKCISNGLEVFGKYATRARPVLILDLENNGYDMAGFRDLFARLGPTKIHYCTRKTGIPALDGPGLLRFCEKHQPLIVLDSMTKFLNGKNPFHPEEMSSFFDRLLTLCATGTTIILIHHATRADTERYANSHQIGANVARSFLIVSEDRPRLHRVRFEGQLFRSGEPVTENLIAFPVVADHGHFGLADHTESPIDRLVRFVEEIENRGEACTAERIKSRKGIGRNRSVAELNEAVKQGRLAWPKKRGPVSSVRNAPYGANENSPYPPARTDSTEDNADDGNSN
jgi:hypothetical protein